MEAPPGLHVQTNGLACKLRKSLYDLKQANRQWYDKLTESLCSRGYVHYVSDYSLFFKKDGASAVFVAVYVDDVILTGTDLVEIQDLKSFLHQQFKIKDLGRLHYFLGLEVLHKDNGVLLSQRKFTKDLLTEYNCLNSKHVPSPLDSTLKLKATEGRLLSDPAPYRKLVGKLNFLTSTRMDIAYSVQHLSQFMQTPREPHYKEALHVLQYLCTDPTLGIFFSNDPTCTITAYCDSDWASCPDSRRSVSGYIIFLGDSPVSWKSKKQSTVSLSSAEAEYRSIRNVVSELVWLDRLLNELTMARLKPIPVFCDSQAAIHIARNPVFHERTKYIDVDCTLLVKSFKLGSLNYITLSHLLNWLIFSPRLSLAPNTIIYLFSEARENMNMVKVGPAGGSGGTIWDEKGRDQVAGIVVTYNKYTVLALQFLFFENGNLVMSNKHGDHRCENFRAVLFDYSSEFITSISGYFKTSGNSTYLKTITLGTNKGSYGPFGSTATSTDDMDFNFQLGNYRLFGGFHGSKTGYGIESIGIYVKPIISTSINLKDHRVKDEKINSPSYKLII